MTQFGFAELSTSKVVALFDLGFAEMMIIGIVALIVVGPKDLPNLFRSVGQFVGKARGMAREFNSAMNQAADNSGMKDIQNTIKSATNPVGTAMDGVKDAAKSLTSLDDVKPDSETGKLAKERAEAKAQIEAATARKAAERLQRQAEEAAAKAEAAEAALKDSAPKETGKE